jgi:hypothetical protein
MPALEHTDRHGTERERMTTAFTGQLLPAGTTEQAPVPLEHDTAVQPFRPKGEQVWTTADYQLTQATKDALRESVPKETRRKYEAWWSRVATWALSNGRVPLPMHPNTLTEWVRELCETRSERTGELLSGASLEQAVAAVRSVHTIAGYDGQPGTKDARRLIRAHKKKLADLGRRPKQSAVLTPEQVADCVRVIERDLRAAREAARAAGHDELRATVRHLRNRFIVTGSFSAWTRRSELAALNRSDVTRTEAGIRGHVRTSKTDQTGKGRPIRMDRRGDVLDPVTAWAEYTNALTALGITDGRLLRRVDRWGNVDSGLSGDAVNDITQDIARRAGHAVDAIGRTLTAQGWRASGNTAAKRAGASLDARRRRGGWSPKSRMPDEVYDRDQDPDGDVMVLIPPVAPGREGAESAPGAPQ